MQNTPHTSSLKCAQEQWEMEELDNEAKLEANNAKMEVVE